MIRLMVLILVLTVLNCFAEAIDHVDGPKKFVHEKGFSIEIPACKKIEMEDKDTQQNVFNTDQLYLSPLSGCPTLKGFQRDIWLSIDELKSQDQMKVVKTPILGGQNFELFFIDNSKSEKKNYYVVRSNPENRMMELNGYKFCGNFYVLLRYQNENNQPKLDPALVEKFKKGDLSIFSETMKMFDSIQCPEATKTKTSTTSKSK